MRKIIFTAILTNLKLFCNMINENKIDSESDKVKNLPTSFMSSRLTKADYLIFSTKKSFNFLQIILIEILIFYYFHFECHIYIETNISDYIISIVLSYLTLNNLR